MATRRRRQRRRTFDFVIPASLRLGKDRSSRRRSRTGAKGIVVSRVLAGTLLLVMTVLLAWFFLDMRFYVSAAQIQGTALIDAEEVYRASGLDGYSIFYINRAQVTKRICTEVPGIEQVHVDCQLPDRLLIRIEERNVRFIWHAAGTAFLVDGTGRLLQIDDGSHAGLVSVQDLDERPLQLGDQVDVVALRSVEGLHSLLPEIRTFEYSQAKGVSLFDARGWRVYFGDDQLLPQKVASMHAILQKIASRDEPVRLIDLRFVGSPYYE